jgi:hypothetical protein
MIPYAGKVRDWGDVVRFAAERSDRRRRLRHRGHRNRSHQCREEKEIPLHAHWSPPDHEHRLFDPASQFRLFWHLPAETSRAKLKRLTPGLTPRAVLDKLAVIQMLDVHFPTTDGRTLILSRYTELNADQKLLVKRLKLDLPGSTQAAGRRPRRVRAQASADVVA